MDGENNSHRFIDRRKYPRINASISYSIKDNQNFFIPQSLKNISSGGIAFFAREKLSVGAILDIVIDLPNMSDVQTMVKVIWCEPVQIEADRTICSELGVEFINLDQNDRTKVSKYVFLRLDKN